MNTSQSNSPESAASGGVGGADIRPLSSLPNREGFKFRGIRKDGKRYMNCRLKSLPGCGMYIVDQGGYVYDDAAPLLAGWMPHPRRGAKR